MTKNENNDKNEYEILKTLNENLKNFYDKNQNNQGNNKGITNEEDEER